MLQLVVSISQQAESKGASFVFGRFGVSNNPEIDHRQPLLDRERAEIARGYPLTCKYVGLFVTEESVVL